MSHADGPAKLPSGALSRALASHLASARYRDLPAAAVHAAKRSLLDAVGVSLAASGMEPACAPFAELAAEHPGPCSLLGSARRCSPTMAAFANGALAHALDFEDAYDGAPVHPNAASVPVALALAESDPRIAGQALVCALACASDLQCRLALALRANPDERGFYPPPIFGAFGAAAAAANLLQLNEPQCGAALALTLLQATCSAQWKADPQATVRAVRDAFPAQAGLTAALLAARGVAGFEGAIDGRHGLYGLYAGGAYEPKQVLDRLGTRWLGAEVSYKPWPSCRGTHAFIEAALRLRAQGLSVDAVERIEAYGAPLNRMLMEPEGQKRAPRTAIDAKFSLPFCLGLALTRGAPALDDFAAARLDDPQVLAVAACVTFRELAGATMRDATRGELVLQLRDGSWLGERVEHPLGHPDNPLGDDALLAKFVDCAGRAAVPLSTERARSAASALLAIDEAPSVHAVLRSALA